MRKIGDILEAKNRSKSAGRHYIVYVSGMNERNFIGAMITSLKVDLNRPMRKSYFRDSDEEGKLYKVTYKKSNLVVAKLVKFESWGPFTKVGELTEEGIQFLVSVIEKLEPETWEDYLNRTSGSFSCELARGDAGE